jgi:hypothetical protein
MQRKGDPWTDHQVSLAVIAVLLGFSCIVVFTLNRIHDHLVAEPLQISVTNLPSPQTESHRGTAPSVHVSPD